MKKAFIMIIFATALLTAAGISASAQTRIQFGKGKTVATVSGTTGEFGTSYVVRAKSGQKITLTLTPVKGVGIRVTNNGKYGENVLLRRTRGGTYVVGLDESGDYLIFLGSTGKRSASFTLTVSITAMTDI